METLLEILNDIDDTVNWEDETALIDDRILDSFGVISLISELEDQFVSVCHHVSFSWSERRIASSCHAISSAS